MAKTLDEALRHALAQKRMKDVVESRAKAKEEPGEPEQPMLRIKYVRCRNCTQALSYDAFIIMHGGRPHFCECPPGQEDLVTFWVEIPKRDIQPCI